ncbi:MAG: ABC transporter permease [bacterium]|nr:ABC transporter permease [bacterium]
MTGSILVTRANLLWKATITGWRLFRTNRIGILGLVLIMLFAGMALIHPVLMSGLRWYSGLGLFLLLWPPAAQVLRPVLGRYRRLTLALSIGVTAVAVVVIGLTLGGAWEARTYDPVVGVEEHPPTVVKTVVERVTDPETQLSMRESLLYSTEEGFPLVLGDAVEIREQPTGPYGKHLLGTDPLGRDILSQLMKGAQGAFLLGTVAALVTVLIATGVGSVAAYLGGWIDALAMRFADLLLMLPALAIFIVASAVFNFELWHLAIFIGVLSGFGGTAIVLKSQALAVKVKPFIEAARVSGGSKLRVIAVHIVPNVMPLSLLYMMFTVTAAIQTEATLSFLGLLNVEMSWGLMIELARNQGYFLTGLRYWWLVLPAGMCVSLLAAAFFLVGRAMDEIVNPRLRER